MLHVNQNDGAWVYLVEDDPATAAMYRLGLEMQGFQVSVAGSGEELFGSLDGRGPDIVVLDYQLPGASGADVLEKIRGDARTRPAMVFMLSNFPQTYDGAIDRVIKHGAIAWFEKTRTPPGALCEKLTEALNARAGSRTR